MLSILPAHGVYLDEQECSQHRDHSDADIRWDTSDVHGCINDEQRKYTTAQVPYVLGLQSLKFNGLIDALVDLINTVCHNLNF